MVTTVLIILICLTVLFWILSFFNLSYISSAILCSILLLFFSFLPTHKEDITPIRNYEVIKTSYSVIIDSPIGYKVINDTFIYNLDNEEIIPYIKRSYNVFGMKSSNDKIIIEYKENE